MNENEESKRSNAYQGMIDAVKAESEAFNKSLKELDKKKKENPDMENDGNEVGYVLYKAILDSNIRMMETKQVEDIFNKLSISIGEDSALSIVALFITCMNNSSYNALTFYDELLKGELNQQFEPMCTNINKNHIDIQTLTQVLEIHKKSISELKEAITINNINKEMR
jgi:hypothetical protein